MSTLELMPVRIALPHAQETELSTSWGTFYARLWETTNFGWLGYVTYQVGEDICIHRNSPGLGMSEIDALTWIQQAYQDGPRFILPMLEDL